MVDQGVALVTGANRGRGIEAARQGAGDRTAGSPPLAETGLADYRCRVISVCAAPPHDRIRPKKHRALKGLDQRPMSDTSTSFLIVHEWAYGLTEITHILSLAVSI